MRSVLDATTPGHENYGKTTAGGPGIFADVLKACGPEACKLRKLVLGDFHMAPDEALKFADGLGERGTKICATHNPIRTTKRTQSTRLHQPSHHKQPHPLTIQSLHPANLKELAELEMVNAHLTDSMAFPIAESLSKSNPKMKKVNFGENGLGAETKTKMGILFETTHRGFILDAYG